MPDVPELFTVEFQKISDTGAEAAELVPLDTLLPADSPRIGGEIDSHVQTLAEMEGPLPPIVVHRTTMRIIDGVHRMRSAVLRGEHSIRVRFFDGSEQDAFVLGVRLNVGHGLPLTLAERRRAAARIVVSHPHWSDRAIAAATGLSAKTLGEVRKRSLDTALQPLTRVGRDGRSRPLNRDRGRRLAAEYLSAKPDGSLREVARFAGISPETVRDVREKLRRGQDPVLSKHALPSTAESLLRDGPPAAKEEKGESEKNGTQQRKGSSGTVHHMSAQDGRRAIAVLRRDPSLRFSNTGRYVLRLLDTHTLADRHDQLIDNLPEHTWSALSEAARECAATWSQLAEKLEQKSRRPSTGPQITKEIRIG
ncbi:ParB N-terminal domain-containing protein [Streptomyces shenzhenensis]|uniref:ParB N-terminal domain-containing protein n=1 Tax=Streptomyces shenzhenensis TaxID=943815 RepID=UPI0036801A36